MARVLDCSYIIIKREASGIPFAEHLPSACTNVLMHTSDAAHQPTQAGIANNMILYRIG